MKKIITSLLAASTFFLADAQQVINLLTGEVREGSDAANPVRTVETLEDGYLVTYEFTEAVIEKDKELPNCFLWRYKEYFMDSQTNGEPSILYRSDWLKLEKDEMPALEILECSYTDFHYQLAPAFPPQSDCESGKVRRLPITPYEGFYPVSAVEFDRLSYIIGQINAVYMIYPISYNYEQQTVRAYTKIVYKVTLSGGTTGIEELRTAAKEVKPFTLDGRVATDGARGIVVRGGKKIISNHK